MFMIKFYIENNLSLEIRNGRLTRLEALQIVKDSGEGVPHDDISKFCNFVGINKKKFFEIIEPFRNLNIWEKNNNIWRINNFIIKEWNWK
mgnify:CR=1 FL=1